jgi:sec-independent protein translocase protein TatA
VSGPAAGVLGPGEVLMFQTLAFLPSLGIGELLIIGAIALLVFGNRLPGTMKSLGQSVVQFKKGLKEGEAEEAEDKAKAEEKAKAEKKP